MKNDDPIVDVIASILAVIITAIIMPFITFGLGWLLGWIIKVTIGGLIISGLALININIPMDQLPLFFGVLSVIASFFNNGLGYYYLNKKEKG
jgi:hypothetical protein